jgi:hypothetical protein
VPHFFIYAKDKEEKNVENLNGSVVNKLEYIVPNKPIRFKKIAGELDFKMLMSRSNINLNNKVISKYKELNKNKRWKINSKENVKSYHELYIYGQMREELLSINSDVEYVVDVLVKYLYEKKNSKNKETLWKTFGDVLLNNLKENLNNTKQCECCGNRIEQYNTKKYCDECANEKEKIRKREWKRNSKKTGSENQVC